jgi:hypothetical protein
LLLFTKIEEWLISTPGCSLSAPINFFINGLLPQNLLKKQQSFRKEPKKKNSLTSPGLKNLNPAMLTAPLHYSTT